MGVPRSEVVKLLIPAFLPFNLIKSSLNAAITFCLYKPVVTALRKAGLVRPLSVSASVSGDGASSAGSSAPAKRQNAFWFYIIAALVVITCVLLILSYNKVI